MSRHALSIVQADRLSRASLARVVKAIAPGKRCQAFGTAAAALDAWKTTPADTAIIALDLPDLDGLELISQIVARRLAMRVVALASRTDTCTDYFFAHAGIEAVIDPRMHDEDQVAAILRLVLAGKRPRIRRGAAERYRETGLFERLTPRELHLFCIIGGGCTNEEAAARLGLSARTVHVHRHRIMWKMKVRKREELIWKALELGAVHAVRRGMVLPGLTCARLRASLQRTLAKTSCLDL